MNAANGNAFTVNRRIIAFTVAVATPMMRPYAWRFQIENAATFDFTPYLVSALLFLVLTIPLARFVDWLVGRDRRRQLAGAR